MNKKLLEESFPYSGKITIAEGGYGFVSFNGETIFVPAALLKDKNIENKSIVKGEFVTDYDKKKKKDGYKAISIEQ